MKFPSFIRLPRHKRFNLEPRYYDPVKEEIEERTRVIKAELEGNGAEFKRGKISFERRTQSVPNTSFLQLIIAAALGVAIIGWLFYGNYILYALWAVVPIYLFYRFKSSRK